MTALPGSRRRAEDFSARVDELLSLQAGRPVSTGVRGGVARAGDDRLLGLVADLCEQAVDVAAAPDAAYSRSLRERLVAEAAAPAHRPFSAEQPGARLVGPHRRRRARGLVTAATASVAVMVTGTAGMAVGAQDALPGQALYPVKRGLERLDETMSRTATAKGHAVLAAAATRLTEVKELATSDEPDSALHIPPTLAAFTRQAHRGASLLMQGYSQTGNAGTIADLRTFAAKDAAVLASLSLSTPSGAAQPLHDAAVALTGIDADATDACDDCADLEPLEVPPVLTTSGGGVDASPVDDPAQDVPGAPVGTGTAPDPTSDPAGQAPTGSTGQSADQPADPGTVPDAPGEADPPVADPAGDPADTSGGAGDVATPDDPPATDPSAAPPESQDPAPTETPAPTPTPTPAPTPADDPGTGSDPAADGSPQDAPVSQSAPTPQSAPDPSATPVPDPSPSPSPTDPPAAAGSL